MLRLIRIAARIVLGTAALVALLALALFALGTYLISLPFLRSDPRSARMRVGVEIASLTLVLWRLRGEPEPEPAAEPDAEPDETRAHLTP